MLYKGGEDVEVSYTNSCGEPVLYPHKKEGAGSVVGPITDGDFCPNSWYKIP